jgi:hypothetical protein
VREDWAVDAGFNADFGEDCQNLAAGVVHPPCELWVVKAIKPIVAVKESAFTGVVISRADSTKQIRYRFHLAAPYGISQICLALRARKNASVP